MDFKHLHVGAAYWVVRAFTDYDGGVHPVGEHWVFLRHTFLPYDDGLSLYVQARGEAEWQIRMRWTDDAHGPVVDALEQYVTAER